MPLLVNLRHLEDHNVQLEGKLEVEELDIEIRDEVIRLEKPLEYSLDVQKLEAGTGLLVQGKLLLPLECECVRCLKTFQFLMRLGEWTCHLPLEGEEAVEVSGDYVDLTPYIREDILLEFPQHPLCEPECRGLPELYSGNTGDTGNDGQPKAGSPAWNELNKLKLK